MDVMGVLVPLDIEGINIVGKPAVIIAILKGQHPVMQMVNGPLSEQGQGQGIALGPHLAQQAPHLVIHAADANPQGGAPVAHQSLVVCIVVMQFSIGNQRTHIDAPAVAPHIVDGMLHAVAVAARIGAAVILHIEDGIRPLALLDAHRQITGAEIRPRLQHAHRLVAAGIRQGVEHRLQFLCPDNLVLLQPHQEIPDYILLQAAVIINLHLAVAARNNLQHHHAIFAGLCRQIGRRRRIPMPAAIARNLADGGIEIGQGTSLTHAILQNLHQRRLVQGEIRRLQAEIRNGKLHLPALFIRHRRIIPDLRLGHALLSPDILPRLGQGWRCQSGTLQQG